MAGESEAVREALAELRGIENDLKGLGARLVGVSKNLRHAAVGAKPVAVISTGPVKAELWLSNAIRDVLEDEWLTLCECFAFLREDPLSSIRQFVEDDGGKLLEVGP